MKPEEIEALAERLELHNRCRRGDGDCYTWEEYKTQYGLDLDTAVELLRGMAKERGK